MGKFLDWLLTTRSGDYSSVKKEARRLPKVMPADFKICIAEFTITNNLATATNNSGGVTRSFQLHLTPEKMGKLYRVLQERKFDRIKIIDDVRLDAGGGEFICVYWANKYMTKGSSQACYVHKKWEEHYSMCYFELLQVLREEAKQFLKPLKIVLDEKLMAKDPGYVIGISDSLTPYLFMTELERLPKSPDFPWREQSYETTVIPGYTELTVSDLSEPSLNDIVLRVQFPEGNYIAYKLHIYPEGDQIRHTIEFA